LERDGFLISVLFRFFIIAGDKTATKGPRWEKGNIFKIYFQRKTLFFACVGRDLRHEADKMEAEKAFRLRGQEFEARSG